MVSEAIGGIPRGFRPERLPDMWCCQRPSGLPLTQSVVYCMSWPERKSIGVHVSDAADPERDLCACRVLPCKGVLIESLSRKLSRDLRLF